MYSNENIKNITIPSFNQYISDIIDLELLLAMRLSVKAEIGT